MNAISPFASITPDEAAAQRFNARWNPDVFRSRLLDKFAEIETWAVGRLRAANREKKLEHTLGLRLGALRKLTETQPGLFKNAARAAQLLDDLRQFQELRSTLAHSTLTTANSTEGHCVAIFQPADADPLTPWRDRITLVEDDSRQIISRVSDLANQLSQQVPTAG